MIEKKKKEPECSQGPEKVPLMDSLEEDDLRDEQILQDVPDNAELQEEKESESQDQPHTDEHYADEHYADEHHTDESHADEHLPEDWDRYSVNKIKEHRLINKKLMYLIKWK